MIKIDLYGDWSTAIAATKNSRQLINRAKKDALMHVAKYLAKKIVDGIDSQAPGGKQFVPLKPATIARRMNKGYSGQKALIMTGSLRKAIRASGVTQHSVFAGIRRTAKHKGGMLLADLAMIHEKGSPRARIPARPFMQPVFEAEKKNLQKLFAERLAKNMGGIFGHPGR